MNKRLDYIDIAKGACMMMVIYVHSLAEFSSAANGWRYQINDFIMSFFMPAFFFLSGVFVKREAWGTFLKKKCKTLLVPFLVFYVLGFIFSYVASNLPGVSLHNEFSWLNILNVFYSKTFSNGALWFLIALFWALLLYQCVLRVSSPCLQLFLLGFIVVWGYSWETIFGFKLPLYLGSGMAATLFVFLGSLMKVPIKEGCWLARRWMPWSLFLITLILVILLKDNKASMMIVSWHGYLVLAWIVGILGSVMLLAFGAISQNMKTIRYFGENSIVALCVHFFFIKPLSIVTLKFIVPPVAFIITWLCVIGCCYFVMMAGLKLSPAIFGKSK